MARPRPAVQSPSPHCLGPPRCHSRPRPCIRSDAKQKSSSPTCRSWRSSRRFSLMSHDCGRASCLRLPGSDRHHGRGADVRCSPRIGAGCDQPAGLFGACRGCSGDRGSVSGAGALSHRDLTVPGCLSIVGDLAARAPAGPAPLRAGSSVAPHRAGALPPDRPPALPNFAVPSPRCDELVRPAACCRAQVALRFGLS